VIETCHGPAHVSDQPSPQMDRRGMELVYPSNLPLAAKHPSKQGFGSDWRVAPSGTPPAAAWGAQTVRGRERSASYHARMLAALFRLSLPEHRLPRAGVLLFDVADEGKDRGAIQFSFIVGAALIRCAGA
jgi:hypothetical protein